MTDWSSRLGHIGAGRASMALLAGIAGFLVLTSPLVWSLTHPTRDAADAGPADLQRLIGRAGGLVAGVGTARVRAQREILALAAAEQGGHHQRENQKYRDQCLVFHEYLAPYVKS